MKINNTLKNILRIIVATLGWVIMFSPIYFTLRGVVTSNFTLFNFEYNKGFEVYIWLLEIFIVVVIFLFIYNIIITTVHTNKQKDKNKITANTKILKQCLKETYGTDTFKTTNIITISEDINETNLQKTLQEIREKD